LAQGFSDSNINNAAEGSVSCVSFSKKEDVLSDKVEICAVCAWRADCQKKFSISGKDMRCPDFTKDMSISDAKKHGDEETENSGKK